MSTIMVKPARSLPLAAAKVLVHPGAGNLLNAAGQIPRDGKPWPYDGFTCRLLTDGSIITTDNPDFALIGAPEARVGEKVSPAASPEHASSTA